MQQDETIKRFQVDIHPSIIPQINKLMTKHYRNGSYVATVLIQEALLHRGLIKEVTRKL